MPHAAMPARLTVLILCLGPGASPLLAQRPPPPSANDPVFGTWVLVPERSRFLSGPAPLDQIRIYEPHPDGLKAVVITRNADGSERTREYVAAQDGVEYPFRGGEEADAVILRSEGPYAGVATFTHAGMAVGDARRVISPDGKEMTVTVRIRDNVNSIAVFAKKE